MTFSNFRSSFAVRHRLIVALLATVVVLPGCLGTTVKSTSDLASLNIGEVTAQLAENIRPGPSGSDASENFRHWHHEFQYCRACTSREMLNGQFFGAYRPYCEAKQGSFSYQPSSKYPNGVECRAASGALIFAIYARIQSKPFNSLGNTAYEWFITADSFEPKNMAVSVGIQDEYTERDGVYIKRSKEQEKVKAQKAAEGARKLEEDARKAVADAQRRKEEQIARDLPIVKQIGQKICTTVQGNHQTVSAYALGQPVYGRAVQRDFTITGFTEQVSGSKIRINISGIQMLNEDGTVRSIDKLQGDVVFEPGKPIWDMAANWRPCR